MNQTAVRRFTAVLLAILLMLGCSSALAVTIDAPLFEERRTDASFDDFVGCWCLGWIRSDEAVSLQTYGYIDIFADGSVCVSVGDEENSFFFDSTAEETGDGCIFVPGMDGADDAYYFLFDNGLLGRADTPDNPGTIQYYEFSGEIYDEQPAYMGVADKIRNYLGEMTLDASAEDYEGVWCAFYCTNDDGDLYPLYQVGCEMTITISGDQAQVRLDNGAEETIYDTPVIHDSGFVMISDEFGEEFNQLTFCEDGSLAMVDDLDCPQSAILFLPEKEWLSEMAEVDYDANPQPGEQLSIDSLEPLSGKWTSTHINYGGMLFPVQSMGASAVLCINPDGTMLYGEESDLLEAEGRIENGTLYVIDADECEHYFLLFEGDFLIEAPFPDDLSIVTYYQRLS